MLLRRLVRISASAGVTLAAGLVLLHLASQAVLDRSASAATADGSGVDASSASPTSPALETYRQLLQDVSRRREALAGRYRAARTESQRQEVLADARDLLVSAVADRIAPRWYGTRWAYEGTTQTPREGSIACGYFVSTVLRDAGVALERVSLSQQPAERIILSLTSEPYIRRFSDASMKRFVSEVINAGEGLYVVGLDRHVGFLVCRGGKVRMVHSSGLSPWAVVSESAMECQALSRSRYRVIGRISADDSLLRDWLLGQPVPTRKN
jgi:hypothetical protein